MRVHFEEIKKLPRKQFAIMARFDSPLLLPLVKNCTDHVHGSFWPA